VLGEAGLAARDARPRPRQTEARRRHRAGGHPGSEQGSRRHGPPPIARPGPAASGQDAAARMALAQPAIAAHDADLHCRITGTGVVRV
jgi:hypothetical protein